jgi:hypothetical protein
MRRTVLLIATALAAAVMLVPAAAQARHHRASADRNHDRIPDRWERKHHLSLKVKQTKRDQDHDGLNNLGEFREGTNPRDRDSDNDGVKDGDENPGKIEKFENGVLTITLTSGGSISAKVVDRTEIECKSAPTATASEHGDNEDNSGPGSTNSGREGDDNHGDRENEAGDDHGDRENEAGDDHGNDENENENEQEGNCTTADLTPGTTVHEAHIVLVGGSAVFRQVELIK